MKKKLMIIFLAAAVFFSGCGKSGVENKTGKKPEALVEQKEANKTHTNKKETKQKETVPQIPELTDDELVKITDYIPDAVIDLKYATEDNFTGVVIYDSSDAYLRYGTLKKLAAVQEKLKEHGFGLLIWDAYRPVEAQFKLWKVCPNSAYVANPNNGFSNHSRGNTVDISVVAADGKEIEMPSGFDEFTAKADRDYRDVSVRAAENSAMLEEIMTDCGFNGYSGEWWHYSDNVEYPVAE